MRDKTFSCTLDDFLTDYGPVWVSDEDMYECRTYLEQKQELSFSAKKRAYLWNRLRNDISEQPEAENIYAKIAPTVQAIYDFAQSISKRKNDYHFLSVPRNDPTTSVSDDECSCEMDAYMVEDASYNGNLTCDNIIVANECKDKSLTRDDQDHVHTRTVLRDCQLVLCNDARRMFIYGVTMEDNHMSLSYFSRSHSVKSIAFTWTGVDEATQDKGINTFIRLHLAFAYATPKQLGIDPTVHKAPPNPTTSGGPVPSQLQFIYECLPTSENGLNASKFFKTLRSLSSRPTLIHGRATRVWEVIEVDSIDPANEVPGAEPIVLKDVWLDVGSRTETENVDLMFAAVEKFVSDAHKLYPGPDGMNEFMANDKRFEHFNQPTRDRLQNLLTNQRYRSLFLTKLDSWKGETTKARSSRLASGKQRVVKQKCQFRFVYKEVCSTMWDLPSLGDVMDILRQCLDAAQILYCAGWVHRDISYNNILAMQVPSGSEIHWKVKLADFEFAQPHIHPSQSHDLRTGTPYFMPMEILSNSFHVYEKVKQANDQHGYSFADQLRLNEGHPDYERFNQFQSFAPKLYTSIPANATPNIPAKFSPVTYNCQHDLESLWWVTMYIITCGLGHLPSIKYGATIFKNTTTIVPKARSDAITLGVLDSLNSVLKPALLLKFPAFLDELRGELHHHYIIREIFGQLAVDESYSKIHSLFAEKFDDILDTDDGGWKQVKVINIAEAHRALFDDEPLPVPDNNAGDSASAPSNTGNTLPVVVGSCYYGDKQC